MTTLRQTAFNTFFDYHVDTLKLENNEFLQGYQKNLKQVAEKYGAIDWLALDSEQTSAVLTDVGKNAIGYGLEKLGEVVKTSLGLAGAGVASGDPVQGGAVALAGGLFDLAFDGLAGWLEVDPHVELRAGEWCIIDETGGFRRGLMGGDMLDSTELEEIGNEAPRGVGAHEKLGLFIKSDGIDNEVLEVQSGNTRFLPKQHVRRIDTQHQEELNGNRVLHTIKEYVEKKSERQVLSYDQLDIPVNNRVGDKVNYNGELWEIAAYGEEGKVTITSNGQYREVNWEQLKGAFNQTTARPMRDDGMGSFVSDAQGFSVGEWVYVHYPDLKEYHLAVVQLVDGGNGVKVVSADRRDDDHFEMPQDLQKWLNQAPGGQLGKFRDAVVRRRDDLVRQYRPDVEYNSIAIVSEHQAERYFKTKVASSYFTPGSASPRFGVVASVPVADKEYEAEAYQETGLRMRGGGGYGARGQWKEDASVYSESGLETAVKDKESNSQGMYLIGAACLAGVLIYVYK